MEVKQEVMEKTCKIEIVNKEVHDAHLDTFKTEIKEEPHTESAQNPFDNLNYNIYPLNTEIKYDEDKLCHLEVKQTQESFICEDAPTDENHELRDHVISFICEDTPTDECNELRDHVMSKQLTQCTTAVKKVKAVGKPFTCEICTKHFSHRSHLKVHMMTHTGEKLFACEMCAKRFTYSSSLKIHMKKHTGENLFTCDACTKQFTRGCYLKVSYLKIHQLMKTTNSRIVL
uniref:Zinc finger protein 26-like isoform X5 n=1 Tax=Diabrotica virgifera virgifera TaxID=50390 RepID=A0A6P7GMG8_DIAVI